MDQKKKKKKEEERPGQLSMSNLCLTDDCRDDMHMGPSAHRIMATEIFNGIKSLWILTPNESQNPFSIRALWESLWSHG
jgi:hypothetical protein